tara:strand:+ start:784 stop:1242 length:459 start_codon:yes stop_codon:yes gene_type:complete
MNINEIFGLFGFNKDNDNSVKKLQEEVDSFKESPHFKFGMFYKMLVNGQNFQQQLMGFFTNSNLDNDFNTGLDEIGDYMLYSRAYYWVQEIDFGNEDWISAIDYYCDEEIVECIKLSIEHFEEIEEYEKCGLLKKVQDLTEKHLFLKNLKKT